MEQIVQGIGVVPGIGIAKVKVLSQDLTAELQQYAAGSPAAEAERLHTAVMAAASELTRLKAAALAAGQQQQAEIIDAHYAMLQDPGLAASMADRVTQGTAAPQAALAAAEEFAGVFDAMEDAYLRERAADIRDIGRRLARLLAGGRPIGYGTEPVVVCAPEIEPSQAAAMPEALVKGIVLGQGSTTSHTVIIAKARSIPTVAGVGEAVERLAEGWLVIVDGYSGQVIIDPAPERLAQYQAKAAEEAALRQQYSQLSSLPAVTLDGTKVQLAANIGTPADLAAARSQGAEGVGLFRSEFLFLGRDIPPDEEEQFAAYKTAVEQCAPHVCVIRTMDIGGDKPLAYLAIDKEENPFLGLRAIRISLKRPDLFVAQLKAILRAGAYGKAAIMLPMIISAAEIAAARQYVEQAKAELSREGKEFDAAVPLGIMIETPAAAIMAGELAAECDFFSVGTNDLVQYTLAVDRGNAAVSPLYSYFHPAVLKLLAAVAAAGHKQGIWVGMCGEMAGDPLAAPLLTAMGFDELSMSAPAIARVKAVIRRLSDNQLQQLLVKAMALTAAEAVRQLLVDYLQISE